MVHGIRLTTVNLSSRDPRGLARFYVDLLGLGPPAVDEPEWVVLRDAPLALAFELDHLHVAPVWPTEDGQPPTQAHLEIAVDDLDPALEHALACGARLAAHQPQDDVRVCLDPAGHPFCLFLES